MTIFSRTISKGLARRIAVFFLKKRNGRDVCNIHLIHVYLNKICQFVMYRPSVHCMQWKIQMRTTKMCKRAHSCMTNRQTFVTVLCICTNLDVFSLHSKPSLSFYIPLCNARLIQWLRIETHNECCSPFTPNVPKYLNFHRYFPHLAYIKIESVSANQPMNRRKTESNNDGIEAKKAVFKRGVRANANTVVTTKHKICVIR